MPPPLRLRISPRQQNKSVSLPRVPPSKSAMKSLKFRERLKNNPDMYHQFCQKDALKSRLYRANLNEDQRVHFNNQSKLRMRIKRQKDKERKLRSQESSTNAPRGKRSITTRADDKRLEEKRAKDRQRKRAKQAMMTKKQIDEVNRKRREKRLHEKIELLEYQRLKKEEAQRKEKNEKEQRQLEERQKQLEEEAELQIGQNFEDERTHAAKRKSRSRALKGLPKSPTKFAGTIVDILEKASPKKKAALESLGFEGGDNKMQKVISSSLTDQLRSMKTSRTKEDSVKKRLLIQSLAVMKKYRLQRKVCRHFNVSSRTLTLSTTKKASKRAVSETTKNHVIKFYEQCAVVLPDKKLISKKTLKKTGFLQRPIALLFEDFKEMHPTLKIGLKKFFALRPKHIKPVGAIKFRGCLCEYCSNIELKVAALNKICNVHQLKSPFQGVYGVSRLTMCAKENNKKYNKRECIERKCTKCGVNNLDLHLENVIQKHESKEISWRMWKKISIEVNGKDTVKQELVKESGTVSECLIELKKEVMSISQHLFNASWQNRQFSNLIEGEVPCGTVVMVQDFAENFMCICQDEIQSAHWNHSSATIHPIVCYYNCPHCNVSTMEESLVFITPDKKHDYHAVHHFTSLAVKHLASKLGPLQQILRFSDGASCQYKSKGPFLDVAMSKATFGIPIIYHFFGSRHGKGPSDGESAVVKRQASQAVIGGEFIINNAKDLFNFSKLISKQPVNGKCLHFQRSVFYVEEIDHLRGHDKVDLKTLKGTRKLHSIKGTPDGAVMTRNLSCFCHSCLVSAESGCVNEDYVDKMQKSVIFTRPPKGRT